MSTNRASDNIVSIPSDFDRPTFGIVLFTAKALFPDEVAGTIGPHHIDVENGDRLLPLRDLFLAYLGLTGKDIASICSLQNRLSPIFPFCSKGLLPFQIAGGISLEEIDIPGSITKGSGYSI